MTLETGLGFDVKDLDGLPAEIRQSVIQARIEASNIRASFNPDHVTSWANLIMRLESALAKAKQSMEIFNPPR